jgi:hypothetical protein
MHLAFIVAVGVACYFALTGNGHLPYRLDVVWQERGLPAEETLVPWQRRGVLGDRDAGEQVQCHLVLQLSSLCPQH